MRGQPAPEADTPHITALEREPERPVVAGGATGWRAVPYRTILAVDAVVVATVLGLLVVWELRRVIVLVLIAGFFAIVLDPAVGFLNRHGLRRGVAVSLVFFVGVLAFSGLVYLFARPAYDAGSHFARDLPKVVDQARHGQGRIGHLIKRYHVDKYVRDNAPKIQSALRHAGGPLLRVARSVVAGAVGLVTVLVLAFLLLLEAPNLARSFLALLPGARAERVRRVAGDVSRSVTGYVIGNAMTSLIAGVVIYTTLRILGVPFAFLFGLWVALVDLLPLVGGLLAGVPTVAFALLHSPSAGIVTGIVFLVYQQIENHVLNPVIMSRTVRMNPLLVMLSVLVGARVGGIVGALLAIPMAGALQVIARDVWDERRGTFKAEPTVGPRDPAEKQAPGR
jgi:predicted PurR-regulated permease PerM